MTTPTLKSQESRLDVAPIRHGERSDGNFQHFLFEIDPAWRKEWGGMPEFVMDDHSPHRTINIHFRNDKDVAAFAVLIGQRISPKQKAMWFPEAKPRRYADKIYIDES